MSRNSYISDEEVVKRVNASIQIESEKKKALDIPAVIYDSKTGKIYNVYSDGTKVEAAKRLRKGRYSERVKQKT